MLRKLLQLNSVICNKRYFQLEFTGFTCVRRTTTLSHVRTYMNHLPLLYLLDVLRNTFPLDKWTTKFDAGRTSIHTSYTCCQFCPEVLHNPVCESASCSALTYIHLTRSGGRGRSASIFLNCIQFKATTCTYQVCTVLFRITVSLLLKTESTANVTND